MIVNRLASIVIDVQVIGDTGNPVVPLNLSWTLTDPNGNVINNRENIALTPATTMIIALTGADLPYFEEPVIITYKGQYLSVHGTLDVVKSDSIHIK